MGLGPERVTKIQCSLSLSCVPSVMVLGWDCEMRVEGW